MFSFGKSKKVANIVIDDYVIRIVENNGQDLSSIKFIDERPIPTGLVENGKVVDEIAFYHFIKELVQEWGIKKRIVRFYAPDSLVIMRNVNFPSSLQGDDIIDHFSLEIGQSIHLPFQKPIFDVYPLPPVAASLEEQGDHELAGEAVHSGTMFAVPEDEIRKFTEVLVDSSLQPDVADVRALGIYRYFHRMNYSNESDVFLFFELNLTSVNISIFHHHQLEFLRYQPFDLDTKDWLPVESDETITWKFQGDEQQMMEAVDEQISELERIIGFYNYSIHKGTKQVTQMVVLGDHPNVYDALQEMESRYTIPIQLLKAYETEEKLKEIGRQLIPALGLALKGGE